MDPLFEKLFLPTALPNIILIRDIDMFSTYVPI